MSSKNEIEEQIIQNYQKDEKMMILVFAQWCINHDLEPEELYLKAYPTQSGNQALKEALELTVSKEEAGEVPHDTVLGVLSLFGNDDLAFVVTEEMNKLTKRK
ncbi:hypothetical protein CR194_09890 [Salipaludibacillus keqinensis]|jgi:hypothetical protein|uniref:YxiS n=1 Tax=Salipaludibacillus keqinensis TaxID=2045207 RepID=A0A323TDJ9_9BACI|nr:hypothetical protein [Salipaludibacillus keqinensis]PYZ93472.1 hypothetical protein CR194_09890 [Salipaludibacillus keqinensis]